MLTTTLLAAVQRAIALAQQARDHGNHPFGAVLLDENDHVILVAENTVITGRDVTNHAETNLVRLASQTLPPEKLRQCTLVTSTEPCAMCAGAIHWSQIGRVIYALSEVELYNIIGPSPEHLQIPCRDVFARSAAPMIVIGPIEEVQAEAHAVHAEFWSTLTS